MKALLGSLAVIVVALLGVGTYVGLFASVTVSERDMGPYQFVYVQDTTTDRSRVRDLSHALAQRLDEAGYTTRQPAQVYFPTGRGIQNQIGFVVDRAVTREVLGADTYFRPVPAQRAMVAEFPFRMQLSYAIGHWRVESALAAHRAQKGYRETSIMVILDGGRIRFFQPIEGG
jgi:hypothetical protein